MMPLCTSNTNSSTRTCKSCLKDQDLSNFYFRKDSNKHRFDCKKCWTSKCSDYTNKNKEEIVEYKKQHYLKNKEKIQQKHKKYYQENKEHINVVNKQWVENNKDKYRTWRRKYKKEVLRKDPIYLLKENLSKRLRLACKAKKTYKNSKFSEIIGCDYITLQKHIESKFKPGMTWDNYGEWQFDHIIPYAEAKNREEIYKLSHYTNLQPLWAEENARKNRWR